ncbi:hypothetical protein AVEN_227485-1 [Araneus ventricosus]|uniref:Uncharacterized protein n=1 Tax=Araneus ventricosus TaxID=182803 RepID=A0A4Y2C5Q6_ARAVE|nr:hypothetical protein AVEN_227485-1 [Araneus ventricosus]
MCFIGREISGNRWVGNNNMIFPLASADEIILLTYAVWNFREGRVEYSGLSSDVSCIVATRLHTAESEIPLFLLVSETDLVSRYLENERSKSGLYLLGVGILYAELLCEPGDLILENPHHA